MVKIKYFKELVAAHPERKVWKREQIAEVTYKFIKNYSKYVPCGYGKDTFAYHEYEEALKRIKSSFDSGTFEVPDLTDPKVVAILSEWKTNERLKKEEIYSKNEEGKETDDIKNSGYC